MNSQLSKIVLFQHVGFLCIIILCFLDELLQLPTLVFSDHPFVNIMRGPTLEMLLFLAVWFLVSSSTRRVIERMNYLERFMRVCAWCRRINYQGEWMALEEFMRQGFDTPTTHGICKECLHQQQEALQRAKRARQNKANAAAGAPSAS